MYSILNYNIYREKGESLSETVATSLCENYLKDNSQRKWIEKKKNDKTLARSYSFNDV